MSHQLFSPTSSEASLSSEFLVISHPPSSVHGTASHLNDLHLSIYTAQSDLSPEEIQQKLRDLLKENLELKDTLQQNNFTMRDQFQKLVKWQTEVSQINQQHFSKMEEVRTVVQKLRDEKQELQTNLLTYKEKLKDFDTLKQQVEELESVKDNLQKAQLDLTSLQTENERVGVIQLQLQEELSETSSELKNMKILRDRLVIEKRDLMLLNNELHAKVADYQQSVTAGQEFDAMMKQPTESSSSSFQDFLFVENQLKEATDKKTEVESNGIKDLLGQLYAEQEKVMTLSQEVTALKNKNAALEEELDTLKKKPDASLSDKPITGVMEGLKASGEKFSMANMYMQRYKDRCDSLENWLGVYQDRIESLRSKDDAVIDELRIEIANLRSTLTTEQALNQEDKRNLLEARNQFEILLKDYQALLKSWDAYQQEQTNRGQQSEAYYDIQTRNLNEQIDKLTAKLVISEENLAAKSQEVVELKNKIPEMMQHLETLPILQAQVEVYQNDFRQERESREKMHHEKERALTEIRSLQIRNQQLVDELEAYQRSQFVEFQGKTKKIQLSSSLKKKPGVGSLRGYPYAGHQQNTGSGDKSPSPQRPTTAPPTTEIGTLIRNSIPKLTKYLPTYDANVPRQSAEPVGANAQAEENIYLCPKCEMGFTTLPPLENHVEACLDNDSPFV